MTPQPWLSGRRLLRDELGGQTATKLQKIESGNQRDYEPRAWATGDRDLLPQEDSDDALLAWWSLMQHHGSATRLLDWTANPFVACYFAVKDEPKKDGAIWYFNGSPPTQHA